MRTIDEIRVEYKQVRDEKDDLVVALEARKTKKQIRSEIAALHARLRALQKEAREAADAALTGEAASAEPGGAE